MGIVFIQILLGFSNANNNNIEGRSTNSLFPNLIKIEEQSLEICKSILDVIDDDSISYDIEILIHLYDMNKRSNALMNQIITQALGKVGDEKVIPILMEIARNNDLPVSFRRNSVEILSKKQAPELVDFLVEMLGNPESIDKVNEFALNIMGDLSEERMIIALLEAYQLGRNKYYSLLNTVMNSMDNFENPKIKMIYKGVILDYPFILYF